MELGINSFFIEVEESHNLGLKRIEIVTSEKEKALLDAEKAARLSMRYSIHLPVFLPEWYQFGQWEVFFCDTDPDKRNISFELLEENLSFIKDLDSEYAILHFGGVLPKLSSQGQECYTDIVNQSISKIESLASKYNIRILLEYFGLNKNFFQPSDWLCHISGRKDIGLLIDTGHLYFSCLYNNLVFKETLEQLACHSSAFHIWNTKGKDHYWKYHHVAPRSSQLCEEGWAFSTLDVIKALHSANPSAPVIIEPNVLFGGKEYILESISDLQRMINNL